MTIRIGKNRRFLTMNDTRDGSEWKSLRKDYVVAEIESNPHNSGIVFAAVAALVGFIVIGYILGKM